MQKLVGDSPDFGHHDFQVIYLSGGGQCLTELSVVSSKRRTWQSEMLRLLTMEKCG